MSSEFCRADLLDFGMTFPLNVAGTDLRSQVPDHLSDTLGLFNREKPPPGPGSRFNLDADSWDDSSKSNRSRLELHLRNDAEVFRDFNFL